MPKKQRSLNDRRASGVTDRHTTNDARLSIEVVSPSDSDYAHAKKALATDDGSRIAMEIVHGRTKLH